MKALAGVLGPVVTTFHPTTGEIDLERFRQNAGSHLRAGGLSGVVVAGSTGEAALLDDAERRVLVEAAREVVGASEWLVAGVGAESTRATMRRAQDAAVAGADAVLVVSPHYYSGVMTTDALRGHFLRVADESPRPVILYNIPKYAHLTLAPELVADLSRHGNVVGIKDSSGDLGLLSRYLEHQSSTFSVLTGNGGTWAQALAKGVRGGILGVALFAPALTLEVLALHARGDIAGAGLLQSRLTPLAKVIVGEQGVAGVKAALDAVGLSGGAPRPPLLPLDAAARRTVLDLLAAAEVPTEAATLPA